MRLCGRRGWRHLKPGSGRCGWLLSGCETRGCVLLHRKYPFPVAGRGRPAVKPNPQAQQRVAESIALFLRSDQVDVLEPREVVLRRPRRAAETPGDFRQRQRFDVGEDAQNRLEGTVSTCPMQPQLVRKATEPTQRCSRLHLGREHTDGVSPPTLAGIEARGERSHVARTPRGQRMHETADLGPPGVVRAFRARWQRPGHLARIQWWQAHELDA